MPGRQHTDTLAGRQIIGMGRHRSQYGGRVLSLNLRQSGGAAEHAAARKSAKYSSLPSSHIFQPLALETFGPINTTGITFFS